MDAYELSNNLENAKSISDVARLVKENAIPMLRHMADRLKVMEEQVKHLESQVYGGTTK